MNLVLAGPLALVCAALCHAAHAAPFEVQSRTLTLSAAAAKNLSGGQEGAAHGGVHMPWVDSATPQAARRVNDLLYLTLLELPAPAHGGATFSPPGTLVPATASMDFKVLRNDARVLAIRADAEGCGAYCEQFVRTFVFDARDGHAVALAELLTAKGLASVERRMRQERQRRFTAEVKTLGRTLATQRGHGKQDAIQDTEDRVAFNEMCLGEEKNAVERGDPPPLVDFSLPAGQGLVLTSERCSNHASLALDDVLAIDLKLAAADLTGLLSPYGRFLVLGEGDVPAPATPYGQVLHGRIGGAPVTLRLDRPSGDGSVSGAYFYDKYGEPIPIGGKPDGATLALTEPHDNKLTLTLHGARIDGQWEGGGKKLPVTLAW